MIAWASRKASSKASSCPAITCSGAASRIPGLSSIACHLLARKSRHAAMNSLTTAGRAWWAGVDHEFARDRDELLEQWLDVPRAFYLDPCAVVDSAVPVP